MSQIQILNLTFGYEGSYDLVFENVSFQIDTDWKLGLIGRNGRGKTTLLKLLCGEYPYTGSISSSAIFDYFPFEVDDPTRPAAEITEWICPELQEWELRRELSLLQVDESVLYRPFETLSNGEQTKVLLAALFLKENHFLLIDEPTNHLDLYAREIISKYLNRKKGFILVSHDRAFLDGCTDHILSINRTNIEVSKGNFSTWWRESQRREQFEKTEKEKLQDEIGKLTMAAGRAAGWSDKIEKSKYGDGSADKGFIGHRSAKMMKRAKVIEARRQKAVEEKSGLLKNQEYAEDLSLTSLPYPKKKLAELHDLSVHYDGRQVCGPLRFAIQQGERIALYGKNGCGKSSILKLIAGHQIEYTGSLILGSRLTVSYVPQDTSFLRGYLKEYIDMHQLDESLFKTILRKLDFSRTQFDKDMQSYSSGQKKKVLLAKSLCKPAHLYVWDEPLNYIDILSRIQIEKLILEFKPTLLFVEHDRSFVDSVATERVQME